MTTRKGKPVKALAAMAKKPTPPRVYERVKRDMVRNGVKGLYRKNRRLALALKRERDAMIDELGGPENAPPSAKVLADVIVRGRMLLDSIDGLLLEIGGGVVNRKRKMLAPIVAQRQQLADSIAAQLKTFAEFKSMAELERRIERLEDNRNV